MEKPKRPMTLEESSIFVNVKKLRRLLWWATFNMMPAAKATMGRRMLSVCGEVLGNYTLAYLLREGKLEYLTQAVAHFAELRIDIEQALEDNIFHFPKRKTKNKTGAPEWWDYLVLNKQRVCLQPKPQYTERNRIIRKYKLLKHETGRKRAAA